MKTDVRLLGLSLSIYTWDNVLVDHEIGSISVIADGLESARMAAMNELTDRDDVANVMVSQPSSVRPFSFPFAFLELASRQEET